VFATVAVTDFNTATTATTAAAAAGGGGGGSGTGTETAAGGNDVVVANDTNGKVQVKCDITFYCFTDHQCTWIHAYNAFVITQTFTCYTNTLLSVETPNFIWLFSAKESPNMYDCFKFHQTRCLCSVNLQPPGLEPSTMQIADANTNCRRLKPFHHRDHLMNYT